VSPADLILRFRPAERHMHWAVAIPFMVCYTTALVLVLVYNPDPSRPFRSAFSWAHRISGLCLLLLPVWNFARHWRDARLHLHNVRQAWSWRWDDLRWLALIGPASLFESIALPHQGKFNAGEKINFMVLSATYPVYLASGLLIWFGDSPFYSWLVHFGLALLATPLLFGHLFMATVNPDTRVGLRGMITGFVDRQWARHHYRHWYVEHYGASERTQPPPAAPTRAASSPRTPSSRAGLAPRTRPGQSRDEAPQGRSGAADGSTTESLASPAVSGTRVGERPRGSWPS
jgi:formate dehydrogenase subunit gamma